MNGSDYTFKVNRLELDKFLIKFKCEDSLENIEIEIEEKIKLEFPKED